MKKIRIVLLICLCLLVVGCANPFVESDENTSVSTFSSDTLRVNYIDVGQGDSIFIQLPNKETMLIDAGEAYESENVINYLNNLGITKIDYVVGTHPHTDHIGGLENIVNTFDIGSIYMPKAISTSKTYEDLLTVISNKGLKVKTAKSGVVVLDENNLKLEFIAPNSDNYSELNNYSAVLKLTYLDNMFLFMGDAETLSENEITSDVDADVIKVGHHGSDSSSSLEFVKKVNPSYAILETKSKKMPATTILDYINFDWWKKLDDPHLEKYIVTAINNNNDIKTAALKIEQAKLNVMATRAGQLPTITAGVSPLLLKMPDTTKHQGTDKIRFRSHFF